MKFTALIWFLCAGEVIVQLALAREANIKHSETPPHSSSRECNSDDIGDNSEPVTRPLSVNEEDDAKHKSLSTETVPNTERSQPHHDRDPSNTHKQSGDPYDEAFPDRPIQLIRPDPTHHRRLELVERNVKYLHHINTAVAVVAVVGKFHSGKSFLLNQLMGKKNGFGVGPYVRPQTMGIWMWGKPKVIQLSNGKPVSVIFLDTEGFAASNISESYDAKIFSVATLLSSYLIYNSVKIIDQGDIDYLELLARRTQLFALRSQVTKAHWFEEFNHDLLTFPPLVWVVEDFVQATEDEETPKEWLHRIMDSSSRESSDYDINLLGIFDQVDCHTLFLPATKKHLLQDLSRASEDDLTPEYREERDALIDRIMTGLVPKEKNGKPISGPALATLLEILVNAANEGSMAEIPGRWLVFIDQLKVSSLEDCLTYYESDMAIISRQNDYSAINETALSDWHRSSMDKANSLLSQLLFGLKNILEDALEELEKSMKEQFEKTKELNDKKIQLKCSEIQRKIEIEAEENLQSLVFPMRTVDLRATQNEVSEKAIGRYFDRVGYLRDNGAFERNLEQLKSGLGYIFDGILLKNTEALEALLHRAIDSAVGKFREASKNSHKIPRTSAVLKSILQEATLEATKVFEEASLSALEESLYRPFYGLLKTKFQEETQVCIANNLELIRASCQAQALELVGTFRLNTGTSKLQLPLNDSELNARLKTEMDRAFKTYAQTQAAYDDTPAFSELNTYLSSQLEEICTQRKNENYRAYIKEVEVPLATALKLIQLSADKYDTVFSVHHYMVKVCLLNLDEGKAKHWQNDLKLTIATKFVESSPELQNIIDSKKGWWSSVKGFWQWIVWLFTG